MVFTNVFRSLSSAEEKFWKNFLLGTLHYDPDRRWSSKNVYENLLEFKAFQNFEENDLA